MNKQQGSNILDAYNAGALIEIGVTNLFRYRVVLDAEGEKALMLVPSFMLLSSEQTLDLLPELELSGKGLNEREERRWLKYIISSEYYEKAINIEGLDV